ncbi:TonB-dependent receptor [Ferrovibrio sp.]|uniref:TonB-dependent receptor n=1 Tax=Ferrovibrio sp. TaxID=1917215 RepID=UPI00311D8624
MSVRKQWIPLQHLGNKILPCLLASTALASGAFPLDARAAEAPVEIAQAATAQKRITFNIRPQPLAAALSQFGRQSGLQVTAPGGITGDLQSPGAAGEMTPNEALARLLAGTGLTWRNPDRQTVILVATGQEGSTTVLPPVRVGGEAPIASTAMLSSLPEAYAGGQVATGGQAGLLGNRNVMDTPFNQTSYTSQLIQDQQARKLDDVLANDPSVRPTAPRAYGFDFVSIRGFNVPSTAYGINGLYGLASNFSLNSLTSIERVEALKGPGTLLNGMPPSGGVGGSVNLITKRATDEPITQMTATYSSESQLGTHLDVGRRYGETGQFGVRFNGAYKAGDTELANQSQELATASGAVDFRGERVRLSADIGIENNNTNAMTRYVNFGNLTSVPSAPDAGAAFMPDWGYWNSNGKMGLVQGEVDLTDSLTAYAQAGMVTGSTEYLYSDATITNVNGNFNGSPRLNHQERDQIAYQTGLRSDLETGFVHHLVNFNAAASSSETKIINTTGTAFTSNLYNPVASPTPAISVGDPIKIGSTDMMSYGIADTLSVLDERVQLTIGVRKQYADTDSFNASGQTAAYEMDTWTPGYAIVVKPWQNVSLYANYVEALETGTIVGSSYANAGEILPPYKTTQKETGVKVDWGRLTTTFSAFDITKPLQVATAGNVLTGDGERRHRGAELNVFGKVVEGVRLLGGVMYVDARQEKTDNGTNDGKKVFGVSEYQFNLAAEWDLPFVEGLTLTGRVIHNSEFYANATNTQLVPDWTRYDVGARYELESPWSGKPLVVRFSVENLFNTDYWQGTATDKYVFLGAPRTYLVSTTFNF